jgi:hypothetical protein
MRYRLVRSRNRIRVHPLSLGPVSKSHRGPCVTAWPGLEIASGSMRYRLARSRNRIRVHALSLGPVSKSHRGPCVTAWPGLEIASGSMRYRLPRSQNRVRVHALPHRLVSTPRRGHTIRASRMMRPDVVKRLLILLLMNHLHHLDLVHHFNKLFQPGSSRPALPRHTSFFFRWRGVAS